MARRALCLAIVLLCALLAQDAEARRTDAPAAHDRTQLIVVALYARETSDSAQAITAALRRAVRQSDRYRLGKGDFALDALSDVHGCELPPNAECLAEFARHMETPAFVWGTVERRGNALQAHLHLWQERELARTTLTVDDTEPDAADSALRWRARVAMAELSGITTGKLLLLAGNAFGRVFEHGRYAAPLRDGVAELELTSGVHRLHIDAHGYRRKPFSALVSAGETSVLLVPLEPISQPLAADSATRSRARGTAGLVLLGTGAGAMLAGTTAALVGDADLRDFGVIGAGGLLSGVGLHLLLDVTTERAPTLAPAANLSSSGGRVGVRLVF